MRHAKLICALALILSAPATAVIADPHASPASTSHADAPPPVQSGIYGFSGARSPMATDPEGVIGECIWIFDAANQKQLAKGSCSERRPGVFRVVLQPGSYVVHGPGGTKKVQLKPGSWIKIESIAIMPIGF
jgi:hypothetical protein